MAKKGGGTGIVMNQSALAGVDKVTDQRHDAADKAEMEALEEFGDLAAGGGREDEPAFGARGPDDPGDILISYEPSARRLALALHDALQQRELKCHIDVIDGEASRAPWGVKFGRACQTCSIFMPLVSRAYHGNFAAQTELLMAEGLKLQFMPVMAEPGVMQWLPADRGNWVYRLLATAHPVDYTSGITNLSIGVLNALSARGGEHTVCGPAYRGPASTDRPATPRPFSPPALAPHPAG